MSTEQNKKLAQEFLAAIVSHDAARLASMMSDDATYWALGKPHLFRAAGEKTKAEFCKMMERPSVFKDGLSMKIGAITAEDNRVALEAESNGVAPSGKIYNNTYHFLFTFRDGKVLNVREYMDTQHAAEVFN